MKLKSEFIVHVTETESLLVPTAGASFSGIVRGNSTFGAMLELLKTDTTEEEILRAILEKFDVEEAQAAADVKQVVAALRRIDAIED